MAAGNTACVSSSSFLGVSLAARPGCRHEFQQSAELRRSRTLKIGQRGFACSADQVTGPPFHNRKRELLMAETHLRRRPNEITLVLGPKSSGKSAFFDQYRRQMEEKNKQAFIAVDCRQRNLRSPQDMGRALGMDAFRVLGALPKNLKKYLEGLWPFLENLKLSEKVADVTLSFPELKNLIQREIKNVDEVVAYLENIVEAYAGEQEAAGMDDAKYPIVIFIDEANKLAGLGDDDKSDLQALMDWFVWISKQRRLAHVVLVTSESAFEDWLTARLAPQFLSVVVIGEFEKAEARRYFEKEANMQVGEADWERCYEVLGGNAGLLNRCAAKYAGGIDMNGALEDVVQLIAASVRGAAKKSQTAGYTPAALFVVARAVLSAEGHCVPREEILGLLSSQEPQTTPEDTLLALVQRNVVSVRPFSRWASDILESAFGPCKNLVLAPDAAHLYCWKTVLQPLIKAWEAKEAAAKEGREASGGSQESE